MTITVNQVKDAFFFLYKQVLEQGFTKGSYFPWYSERAFLPLIRFYLLGYFGGVEPEANIEYLMTLTGRGRVDFVIGDVAIEFATRRPEDGLCKIGPKINRSEIIKLMRYDGPSALVLFDFSEAPCSLAELDTFKVLPSLGRGNHIK